MGAPNYNEYWKKRKKHGRNKIFETPEQAIAITQEYIKDCKNNPIIVNEVIKTGNKAGEIIKVERPRIPTQLGFSIFAGITEQTFINYKSKPEYKDFIESFTYVSDIFRLGLMENGLTGEANSGIVMRMLGLTDKKDVTTDGQSIGISVNVQDPALKAKLDKE